MGGCVPPPSAIGDGPPPNANWKEPLGGQIREVTAWIEELRLLLFPRSRSMDELLIGLPPSSGFAERSAKEPEKPGPMCLGILRALSELGAVSPETGKSSTVIAEKMYAEKASRITSAKCARRWWAENGSGPGGQEAVGSGC